MLITRVLVEKKLVYPHEDVDWLIYSGMIHVNGQQVCSPLFGLQSGMTHQIERRDEAVISIDVLIIGIHMFDLKRRKR